ncbi:hypothetical protein [Lyngbya confervoides]|uniref:Uncharacterized protein n=1 Tax=Lyngbya confervoides BDU141951 TaxID=1574623 RepID=A0ABD4T5J2_9CYAN|nr:hypothetical protein [Lyngbya confervoides]MCM1983797.1 hypothetical protein [Lyngbya confervoides BDU141951]
MKRSLRDVLRRRLRSPDIVQRLLQNNSPPTPLEAKAHPLYQPLRETMQQLGISRRDVAGATVLTTGDPVAETAQLSQQILDRDNPAIEGLQLDPDEVTRECLFDSASVSLASGCALPELPRSGKAVDCGQG